MKKFNPIPWWDRNYNLLFHRSKCMNLVFMGNYIAYNDCIFNGTNVCRCLGNGWFKIIDVKPIL